MDLDTEVAAPEAPASRREAIEAAFDAAEAPDVAPAEVVIPEPVEAREEAPGEQSKDAAARTAAEKARDEKGRFQPKGKAAPAVAKPSTPVAAKRPGAAPVSAAASPGATPPGEQPKPEAAAGLKPPSSWKPAAREKWASTPPEVQQEAIRRDREVQAALDQSSDARKNWGSFQQAVAPYAGMIQAEGGSPVQAAAALFQTAAALRTAPAHTKAGIVANIVRTYGIDIGMLDQALAGQAPQPSPGQGQGQGQYRDPRVDELMQRIQNGERQRQESMAQQNAREVEDFGSSAEFFDDVRHEMADILEVAARRGVAMSLEDAYSRAVKLHPEVSEVMAQREKAKAATASLATTQRARAAASSVKSRPAGPAPTQTPAGRRGALEAAWDAHNR